MEGPCRVRVSGPVDVLVAGEKLDVDRPEPDVIAFEATSGQTYEIVPSTWS